MSAEGNPNPTPNPTPAPTMTIPPGSSPTAVSAPTVNVLLDDVQRWRAQAAEFEVFKANAAREAALKEQERLNALAESGKWKQSLDETRASYDKQLNEANGRFAQLEQQVFGEKTMTVLAQSLAGRTFNGKTPELQAKLASQLITNLAPEFEASRLSDGSIQVRHKATGRPAADVLKEVLNSEEYAHWFVPTNRGGSGTDATRSPGNPQQPTGFQAIKDDYFARQSQLGTAGMGLGGFSARPQGR